MSLVDILNERVVHGFSGHEGFLKAKELVMLSLTSKSIYSCLKACKSFKFKIFSELLLYHLLENVDRHLTEGLSPCLNVEYPRYRESCDIFELRKSAFYTTEKSNFTWEEQIKLAKAGDVFDYIKGHSLAKHFTLHQFDAIEHLTFPNTNLVKHEKWILIGKLEAVGKQAEILSKYLQTFVHNTIHTIHYP